MTMSFQLFVSLLSQAISILTGVASVPWLMRVLGAEAYGLIGIYAIVQTWLQWLDAGVSLTASRQAARHQGGEVSDAQIKALVRYASLLFLAIGLVIFLALLIFQDDVLKSRHFDLDGQLGDVRVALGLMFAAAILRWLAGLYKGLLAGFGRQSVVAILNIFSALGRNIIVFPLLELLGVNIQSYFLVHVAVGVVELAFAGGLVLYVLQQTSGSSERSSEGFSMDWLMEVFKYSVLVALNTAAVVFVSQIDRLMLLGVMTLKEFGIYSVIMSIGTVVLSVGSPVASVMIPRLTSLVAEGGVFAAREPYLRVTVLMFNCLISISIAAMWCAPGLLAAFGVLDADVGGADLMLRLYLLGNVFYVISFFPAFLCHAVGDIYLLVVANGLLGLIMLLGMYVGRYCFGASGVALAWCVINFLNLSLWAAFVHRRYFGAVLGWGAVRLIVLPALSTCLFVSIFAEMDGLGWLSASLGFMGQWFVLIKLVVFAGVGVCAGFAAMRATIGQHWRRRIA